MINTLWKFIINKLQKYIRVAQEFTGGIYQLDRMSPEKGKIKRLIAISKLKLLE